MKKLWGGRFKKALHPLMKCFSYSLASDYHLLAAELAVNRAWAKMLSRAGILSGAESKRLMHALKTVGKELTPKDPHETVQKKYLMQYEDIHTLIQARLEKKAGPLARKIHTGRSRNDLVVTSTRLYLREKLRVITEKIKNLQKSLVSCAEKNRAIIVAGLTHLRRAQPVLLAHHLLAYVEFLEDDRARLRDAAKRVNVLALGSGSLAGSSLPIDRAFLARELGFEKISANSMAAVSDRAFLAECMSALAILWMHFSRLAEDFILWNSEPFQYAELDDAFATGSSLMPQKKNPDIFELIRGRSGVIFGYLQSVLVVQKGLALTYNRDLQEDKPGLFDAVCKTELALDVLVLALESVTFNAAAARKSVEDDALYATDILEYLVRKGLRFSDAHEIVGRMVRLAADSEIPMRRWPLSEWRKFSKEFDADVVKLFDAKFSVESKKTYGSTHPSMVQREIVKWKKLLYA